MEGRSSNPSVHAFAHPLSKGHLRPFGKSIGVREVGVATSKALKGEGKKMDKGGNSSLASGCADRSYLFLSFGAKLAIAIILLRSSQSARGGQTPCGESRGRQRFNYPDELFQPSNSTGAIPRPVQALVSLRSLPASAPRLTLLNITLGLDVPSRGEMNLSHCRSRSIHAALQI